MRKVMNWLSKYRSEPKSTVKRRRIDLGDVARSYPIYAIGDVHGRLDLLKQAETNIAQDIASTGKDGLVVLLGDFIDRGPMSAQIINHLMTKSEHQLKRLPLVGNHEDVFLRYLENPEKHKKWLELGGEQTLASYGLDVHSAAFRQTRLKGRLKELLTEAVPEAHKRFLDSLPICLKIADKLWVHAGIRPGIALEQQSDDDMIWIREPFLSKGPELKDLIVIHGHTVREQPDPGPQRIGIDTGAFYTGKLTILRVEGSQSRFL
ncbi:hypothetical protein ASF69_00065 [Rhizobium sp. Leaf311]|uniref:metallophosphoesterase family protein n=1 Tax=Rhizobium sp. Leaf311 TaxID=1736332 RepID=UPI000713834B|nr:metallophosphoesterase family protein [Rhizobium sp. Leaf311]KQQ60886.1 hypothetical protein ASF69_00065 [Rhizobium sp. Leaf311]